METSLVLVFYLILVFTIVCWVFPTSAIVHGAFSLNCPLPQLSAAKALVGQYWAYLSICLLAFSQHIKGAY